MRVVFKYSRQAIKFLKSLDKAPFSRILTKIENLRHNPISPDSKIVEGYCEKLFRARVGDYRILYEVDYNENLIGIIKIDKDQGCTYNDVDISTAFEILLCRLKIRHHAN